MLTTNENSAFFLKLRNIVEAQIRAHIDNGGVYYKDSYNSRTNGVSSKNLKQINRIGVISKAITPYWVWLTIQYVKKIHKEDVTQTQISVIENLDSKIKEIDIQFNREIYTHILSFLLTGQVVFEDYFLSTPSNPININDLLPLLDFTQDSE